MLNLHQSTICTSFTASQSRYHDHCLSSVFVIRFDNGIGNHALYANVTLQYTFVIMRTIIISRPTLLLLPFTMTLSLFIYPYSNVTKDFSTEHASRELLEQLKLNNLTEHTF